MGSGAVRSDLGIWLDDVRAWTEQWTAARDRSPAQDRSWAVRFPVAEVLAAWQREGRDAIDSAAVHEIDRALEAVESRQAGVPDGSSPAEDELLARWVPMLVDVRHGRCRYATYVGTGLLHHLADARVDDLGPSDQVIRVLLAHLLDFELGKERALASSREQPPSDDLTRRRTAAITAALQAWAPPEHQELAGRALTDATLEGCAADLRMGTDCMLVPITRIHDEVLFIRVLQVFEAVFLQVYALLAAGRDRMVDGDLVAAARLFAEAATAQDRAFPVFRVLATIRPDSFAVIRQKTTGASGLQSEAFKRIELLASAPSPGRAASEAFEADEVARHVVTEHPSIAAVLGKDRSARTDPRVLAGLASMDRAWLRWKRSHWAVAAHVIGSSPGTGGTSGVSYLRQWMTDPLFPRLPQIRGVTDAHVSLAARVPPTPMVRHLRQRVASVASDGAEPDVIALPAARRRVGEFKVDTGSASGTSGEADRDACHALADALAAGDGVERAVPVPPNVYVTPSVDDLQDVLLGAVLEKGRAYGSGTPAGGAAVQVQYGCPNLNKALHVGHLRNIFVGAALANIVEAAGHHVIRVDQPSNRGKHIAKAVLAYQLWGQGATPADAGTKPDHFVQHFYSEFARRAGDGDVADLDEQLERISKLLDTGDPGTTAVAERLTAWAYQGIQQTYGRLGARFDAVFAEGDTLDLAESSILASPEVARRRDDESVFVDLSDRGLREITLLRRDGSPLLHAQFLGACLRREELDPDTTLLFVMGEEYRHTVPELLGTLELLGHDDLASRIEAVYHGMVTSTGEKVSSRDSAALTADGLLDQVRERLVREWEADTGQRLGFHERDVCDRLALAMIKLLFLGTRRDRAVELNLDAMWESIPRKIALIVRCLAAVGGTAPTNSDRRGGDPRPALLHLDHFGNHVADSVHRRDPFVLVRYLDDLCLSVPTTDPSTGADRGLARAVTTVARSTLRLLEIDLPPFRSLPPGFRHEAP